MSDNGDKKKREARRRQRAWKRGSKAKGVYKPKRNKNTSCSKGRCRTRSARKPKTKGKSNFLESFNKRKTVSNKKKETIHTSSTLGNNVNGGYSSSSRNPRFL